MRYNSPNSPIDSLRDFVTRGGIPVTMTLIIVNVVLFFAAFFSPNAAGPLLERFLTFQSPDWLAMPWTLLTYPLFSGGLFSLLFGCLFFWFAGGSLERSWGSGRFAGFLAGITVATSLSFALGGLIFHRPTPLLAGLSLPLDATIVAFCMLNPEEGFRYFFFTIRAKYIALIVTVWTLVSYGPIFGVFACGGIVAAFLYVKYGRSWNGIGSYQMPRRVSRGPDLRMDSRPARPAFRTTLDGSPAQRSAFDFAGRWKDWQERRRLEKLWKNSGFSSSEAEWRDDEKRRK